MSKKCLTKQCSECEEHKPFKAFYKRARWYSALCKECCKTTNRPKRRWWSSTARNKLTGVDLIARDAYSNARKRALRAGKPFNLTQKIITNLFKEFCDNNYHDLTPGSPFRPSLDRIDNSKSYIIGNVQVVWLIENLARGRFSEEQLVEFCKRKLGLWPNP
jgi:hypothetical protein